MAHIVKNEPWGIVDLDTERGTVFVRQDWHYKWRVAPPMRDWSPSEEHAFHHAVDHMIWARWSRQVRIRVKRDPLAPPSKTDHLVGRFSQGSLSLTFDVRQVRGGGHWATTVTKVSPLGKKPRAEVRFDVKEVFLYSTDQRLRTARRFADDPTAQKNFSIPAHEFGHTLKNDDEYEKGGANFDDLESIMNIGRDLRPRHLHLVMETLAQMVPGYAFSPIIIGDR